MLHSEGDCYEDSWCKLWLWLVSFKNCHYDLPTGSVGKDFVVLLSSEIDLLAQGSVRSERVLVFLSAMLQRDPMVQRGTDIRHLLARRLQRWKDHCFEDLVNETERCAWRLPRSRFKHEKDRCVKVFTHLMLWGQVQAAVRFITNRVHGGGGVLSLVASTGVPGHSVLDILHEKHPEPGAIDESAFMSCDDLPPLLDLDITADYMERVAHQIQGSSGPCGSTALQWHGYLLRHGVSSALLRDAVAMLARRLANGIVDWESICTLMVSRLIALDKCPGVCPIGIGEALRHILCKVIALATRTDLEDVCGVAQLCSGLRAGMEGTIHAVHELFDLNSDDGWGVLLVDARNAFNSVNRVAALWNARVLWPRCSRFLFSSYHGYARLLIQGSDHFLLSKEGVKQGDPLSMMLYAVAVLPLIRSLEDSCDWVQNWYTDDSSCVGGLSSVRRWFNRLLIDGPAYGYFPEPSKTVLVVGSSDLERASDLFHDLGVSVVTGSRFLGGFVGERSLTVDFVSTKVKVWCECIQSLSDVAIGEPQASFAALARSLQYEWNHIHQVIPECVTLFAPLQHAINSIFYPSLFGAVSENEIALFSLPTPFGGLLSTCHGKMGLPKHSWTPDRLEKRPE